MTHDLVSNTSLAVLAPAVRTADAALTADLTGYNSALFAVLLGTEGDTLSSSVKIDVKVEHSDAQASGFTAVDAADLIRGQNCGVPSSGVIYTADDNAEAPVNIDFGYRGSKAFVRVTLDFTGSHTTGTPTSIVCVRGNPQVAPAA